MMRSSTKRIGSNDARRKMKSSSTTLQALMYTAFGSCILVFTFLAGHHDCQHSDVPSTSTLRGSAVAKSLTNFDQNNDKFIPRTDEEIHFGLGIINVEKWGKPIQRPDDWETWNFYDIHYGFKCGEHSIDQNKPLPDMAYWNYARETFKFVVGPSATFDDPIPPTEGYTLDGKGKQPNYSKISPGKGRGLYASRDIKKGEVVHDGADSDTQIPSGMDYRHFLFSLPQKMACDFTEWTWTQQTEEGGPYKIFTAFNNSILLNSSKDPNVMPKNSYSSRMYATRDIKKDEELLTDYAIYPTKYGEVGM